MDPHSWNGIGNGATGDDDFENILSILDFPMESLEADGLAGDWDASKSQYLGPIPSDDVLMGPPVVSNVKIEPKHPILFPLPLAPSGRSSIKVDTATEVKPPLYQFSDSSSSNAPRQNKCTEVQEHSGFQSRSPVSVLESSTSSLAASGRTILTKFHINKRTRSRRARPLGCNPWLLISVPVVPSSGKTRKIKTMRKKPAQSTPCAMAIVPHPSYSNDAVEMQNAGVVKKCSHCEVTKTPQWREGPVGPKTLCNACGVRYRSGRLFPEYRPAASPTFVPTIHSNSHKKVLEMRNKGKVQVM